MTHQPPGESSSVLTASARRPGAARLGMTAPLETATSQLNNLTWHPSTVSEAERQQLTGQKGCTLWLTGLSGIRTTVSTILACLSPPDLASGKSTIAVALEAAILQLGKRAFRLDGDNVRFGLNKDLGFSERDRNENIRRIGEVAKLFASSSTTTITAFISPYLADRDVARKIHEQAGLDFIEVFVDAPLEEVERRDPKGLYKKARSGELKEFTGVSAPYEAPRNPEVHIETNKTEVFDAVKLLIAYMQQKGLL